MLALALFAGRQLSAAEHLGNLSEALMGVTLPDPIKNWLLRMLYLDARRAYVNATEAAQGLEDAVAESTIRPVPLVLASLGIRTQRVNTTVTVRTAEPRPLRPVPVKKPAPRAVPQDPWIAHDVDRRVPTSAAIIDEDRPGRFGNRFRTIVKIGILGAALAGAFTVAQFLPPPAFLFSKTGILAVETNPVGAQLLVDGTDRGVTPLTLKLESGGHDVEVRSSGRSRAFHVYVSSGSNVTQHVELRNAPRIRKSD